MFEQINKSIVNNFQQLGNQAFPILFYKRLEQNNIKKKKFY